MNEENENFYRLVGQMHGQIQGLRMALVMAIASDRNVRAAMLLNLPNSIELIKSDQRNWETEVDKLHSTGFVSILENILEMLKESQEAAP